MLQVRTWCQRVNVSGNVATRTWCFTPQLPHLPEAAVSRSVSLQTPRSCPQRLSLFLWLFLTPDGSTSPGTKRLVRPRVTSTSQLRSSMRRPTDLALPKLTQPRQHLDAGSPSWIQKRTSHPGIFTDRSGGCFLVDPLVEPE